LSTLSKGKSSFLHALFRSVKSTHISIFCSSSSLVQCWPARLDTRLLWSLSCLEAFVLQLLLPLLFLRTFSKFLLFWNYFLICFQGTFDDVSVNTLQIFDWPGEDILVPVQELYELLFFLRG
jgi:hypothetical protein